MINRLITAIVCLSLSYFFMISCRKNETKYYADKESNGLSVFSNMGDNVFSCDINGNPWRTADRYSAGLFSPARSEIFLRKQSDSINNMLLIQWSGDLEAGTNGLYTISLYLNVSSAFTNKDIGSLQGKRLTIDSTNGYFFINGLSINGERGSGNIYFNKASFDSTTNGAFTGRLSGLLEATSTSYTLTNGRFDHELTRLQVGF